MEKQPTFNKSRRDFLVKTVPACAMTCVMGNSILAAALENMQEKPTQSKHKFDENIKSELIEIIKMNGLDLASVKQILDPVLSPEFSDAIHKLTEGNPMIINTIRNFDENTLKKFGQKPIDEGAMALVLKAHSLLDFDNKK